MRVDVCRHYGLIGYGGNRICKAGIDVRAAAGDPHAGWYFRTPCQKRIHPHTTCDRREFPTAEEVAAATKEFEEAVGASFVAEDRIRAAAVDGRATCVCPKCGGEMHGTVSPRNGHVNGRCTTEGCLVFAQ